MKSDFTVGSVLEIIIENQNPDVVLEQRLYVSGDGEPRIMGHCRKHGRDYEVHLKHYGTHWEEFARIDYAKQLYQEQLELGWIKPEVAKDGS